MAIFQNLGINETVWIQLAIFLVTFFLLKKIVFEDYVAAMLARQQKTHGGADQVAELQTQSSELHSHYEAEAKTVNQKISAIFKDHQDEADKEFDRIVSSAKAEAQTQLENTQKTIMKEVQNIKIELTKELPLMTEMIVSKMAKGQK